MFFIVFSTFLIVLSVYAESGDSQVLIPGGKYNLGSYYCEEEQGNADWCSDEVPHKVELGQFWIDKYEITIAQYKAFLDAIKSSKGKAFELSSFKDS